VNNILNQEVRVCVFLLGQAIPFSAVGHGRYRTCAFRIIDKLACFQGLSAKNSARMVPHPCR
jgi:hypothetical protein